MADYAASPAGAEGKARAGLLRGRLSPWSVAVAVSVALLLGAGTGIAALWATAYAKSSSEYTAKLPSTLLGVEVAVAGGDVEIVGGGAEDVIVPTCTSRAGCVS